mmetsp:Transcript_14563/g.21950  ORF Transcript_14563/g.21950 Transcript_14563/m.21950 type:complete len:274 (-) Transcript_14563:56-877(-)
MSISSSSPPVSPQISPNPNKYNSVVLADVKGARKLKIVQTIGEQDPYLRIWTSTDRGNKYRTPTYVDGGSIAVWNEKFELNVSHIETCFILIEVRNENNLRADTIIGRLKIPCCEVKTSPSEAWYAIYNGQGEIAGEVQISLQRCQPKNRWPSLHEGLDAQIKSKRILSILNSREDNGSDGEDVHRVASTAAAVNVAAQKLLSKRRLLVESDFFRLSADNSEDRNASITPVVVTNSADMSIPEGWEERRTAYGKPYFFNNLNKISTWLKPVAS